MRQFWMVYCKKCNKAVTGAVPPGGIDFIPVVQCVTCNASLDANVGRFVLHPIRLRKQEPVDLLRID